MGAKNLVASERLVGLGVVEDFLDLILRIGICVLNVSRADESLCQHALVVVWKIVFDTLQ